MLKYFKDIEECKVLSFLQSFTGRVDLDMFLCFLFCSL